MVASRLSRREFLVYCGALAAWLGLSELYVPQIARAIEQLTRRKVPLVWLQGQACAGCTISTLNSGEPTAAEIILDVASLRYQPNLMAATGDQAMVAIQDTIKKEKGRFVAVIEGSIPTAHNGAFCVVGRADNRPIPFTALARQAADAALATVAAGTCAAYGGIPAANKGVTGARGAEAFLNRPVVNVPGCPTHPDWLVGTLVKLVLFGKDAVMADLDGLGRPKEFFRTLVHDNCPRRHWFEAGLFVEDWNDPAQAGRCLLLKGCKGPFTFADCPKRRWNDHVNFCIDANAPCAGCTQPEFYARFAPLYQRSLSVRVPGLAGAEVSADRVGMALGVATAVGIGAHLAGQIATGRLGHGGPREGAGQDEGSGRADGPGRADGEG